MSAPHRTVHHAREQRPPSGTEALDELDVAIVVRSRPAGPLAAQQAALAAELGPGWRGGLLVAAAGHAEADAALQAVDGRHPSARRTLLRLPRRLSAAAAANLLLAEATGEHVALLHGAAAPQPGAIAALLAALDADPRALWAAPPTPGLVVLRRAAFVELGAFDPALHGAEAVADAAARAADAGLRLVTAGAAGPAAPGEPSDLVRRRPGGRRRPWSAAALERWLPRARLAVDRTDLP